MLRPITRTSSGSKQILLIRTEILKVTRDVPATNKLHGTLRKSFSKVGWYHIFWQLIEVRWYVLYCTMRVTWFKEAINDFIKYMCPSTSKTCSTYFFIWNYPMGMQYWLNIITLIQDTPHSHGPIQRYLKWQSSPQVPSRFLKRPRRGRKFPMNVLRHVFGPTSQHGKLERSWHFRLAETNKISQRFL